MTLDTKWQDLIGYIHNGMGKDQRTTVIYKIVSILYADDVDGNRVWDPDKEWSGADVCQDIAAVLESAGLVPTERIMCEASEPDAILLAKPVSALNLSVRSRKCVLRMGISTIGQLIKRSSNDLYECRNFGITSLQEIHDKLAQIGLSLREYP